MLQNHRFAAGDTWASPLAGSLPLSVTDAVIRKADEARADLETAHSRKSVPALACSNRPARLKKRRSLPATSREVSSKGPEAEAPIYPGPAAAPARCDGWEGPGTWTGTRCRPAAPCLEWSSCCLSRCTSPAYRQKRATDYLSWCESWEQRLKMPPRQVPPGGTDPVTLTFRFVATCQARSIFAQKNLNIYAEGKEDNWYLCQCITK